MLLLHSFWLPQILNCVRMEARQPLLPPFVVGMTLTRLALPLYLFGCPHNLLRLAPNYGLCAQLVLYMAAQVKCCFCALLVCLMQERWIPSCHAGISKLHEPGQVAHAPPPPPTLFSLSHSIWLPPGRGSL